METIVNYLKSQLNPRSNQEFIEKDTFDPSLFDQLVQDGFYVSKEPPLLSALANTKHIESIKIGDFYLSKKAIRNVAWLEDEDTAKFSFDNSRDPIYRRLVPPPAEAVDHVLILKAIASTLKNITYIEYGVSGGNSFKPMVNIVDTAYGIDIINRTDGIFPSNTHFYQMTTDEFSEKHLPNISFSLCFIDADHAFTAAYKDFTNIIKYIQPGGYVILHDTYPCSEEFLKPYLCNDCYKTPIQIKKDFPNLEILTLPMQPGLTIVRKSVKELL